MGTNYYVIPKDIDEAEQVYSIWDTWLKEYKYNEAIEAIRQLQADKCIHIGKSSYGWEFAFNHNNERYYKKTRESIDNFIRSNTLKDEYGREISADEFWKLVDSKIGGETDESWSVKHPDSYIRVGIYDFKESGLRFLTSTEFD